MVEKESDLFLIKWGGLDIVGEVTVAQFHDQYYVLLQPLPMLSIQDNNEHIITQMRGPVFTKS